MSYDKMELKVISLLLSVSCICMGDRVVRVGNELKASSSGVDQVGVTFLMNDAPLIHGVLFAYSAFFRNDAAVRFGVWRKNGSDTDKFILVAETRHKPSLVNDREDIYIESKLTEKCVKVQQGDRLGVYFEEGPGSVSYTFDASSPQALGSMLPNVSYPNQVGDIIPFDRLTFPYDFSAAAHIDTDMSVYSNMDPNEDFVDCPKGLLIPDYKSLRQNLTTMAPPTGRPGDTGAPGPQGHQGVQGEPGKQGGNGAHGEQGATGIQGLAGKDGINGAGATGARGHQGEMGASGERGPEGEMGPQGPRGLPGPIANVPVGEGEAAASQQGMFSSPMFSIGAAIWLIVLTILIIVVLAVIITSNRRRAKKEKLDAESANQPGLTPQPCERVNSLYEDGNQGGVDNPAWMSTLKRETEAHVANTTIVEEEVEVSNDTQSENLSENSESLRVPTYASNSYLHYEDSCNGSDAGLVPGDNGSTNSSEFSKPEMVY